MPAIAFVQARAVMASAQAEHAGMACRGKAVFSAVQALEPCFMFGVSVSKRHATGRGAHAQSGCLSSGSPLTKLLRQSATCHCLAGRLSFGSQRNIEQHQSATHHRQVDCPSVGGQRTNQRCRRPSASGRITANRNKKVGAMQRSEHQGKAHPLYFAHRPNCALQRTLTRSFASAMPYGRR